MKDRVYDLAEARTGYVARRRQPPRRRAPVMPGDPAWLHEGPTWVLDVRGSAVAFFSIGAVARGAGRSVGTIRTWEKRGLIPKPTYTKPGRGVAGPKRAYLRSEIFDIIAALEQAGLIGQRPQRWSGPLVGPRA